MTDITGHLGNAGHATLRDVAANCGLSVTTVSRVLSDSDYPVARETRERVLAVAHRMHYIPNAIGQSLKKRNSRVIGVVLPNLTNSYYSQLLQAIEDEAMKTDWHIILCSAHRKPELEERSVDLLLRERVSGIILASIDESTARLEKIIRTGIPLVTLEQKMPVPCSHIGFDYAEAARIAVRHLARLGSSRIAYVGAPLDRFSRREMLRGFQLGIAECGLVLPEEYIWYGIDEQDTAAVYELENGQACARSLTKLPHPPSAYFCVNDMTAIGLIRGLQTEGARIPEDVSVIGIDDISFGRINIPSLSTINQHTAQMGSLAFRQLIDQVAHPEACSCTVTLQPELIIRESTKALPE